MDTRVLGRCRSWMWTSGWKLTLGLLPGEVGAKGLASDLKRLCLGSPGQVVDGHPPFPLQDFRTEATSPWCSSCCHSCSLLDSWLPSSSKVRIILEFGAGGPLGGFQLEQQEVLKRAMGPSESARRFLGPLHFYFSLGRE